MRLNSVVDKEIQKSLREKGIKFQTESNGKLLILKFKIDESETAGMLYLKKEKYMPSGALPFTVIDAPCLYGVFHLKGEALIIEVSGDALDHK
jgi:hypothetical protein